MSFTALATYNRERLTTSLLSDSVAIIGPNHASPAESICDTHWLTGLPHAQIVLLLFPDHPDTALREVLFVPEPEPGHQPDPRLTLEEAASRSGISTMYWLTELERMFNAVAPLAKHIYLLTDEQLRPKAANLLGHSPFILRCLSTFPLHDYQRLTPLLARLRQVKSPAELARLRTAAHISEAGLLRVLSLIAPGVSGRQLEGELLHEYRQHEQADWAGAILAVGTPDDGASFYRTGQESCRAGDLIQLNPAASYEHYHASFTRTIPVTGRYTPRQRAVHDAVARVHLELRTYARAGQSLRTIQEHCEALLMQELLALHLVTPRDLHQHGAQHFLQQYTYQYLTLTATPQASDATAELLPNTLVRSDIGICIPYEHLDVRIGSSLVLHEGLLEDLTDYIPVEADELEALMRQANCAAPVSFARPVAAATSGTKAVVIASASARSFAPAPASAWAQLWRHAYLLLIIPLLLDLGYSYVQHLNAPHDGDMVAVILPRYWQSFVLEDPLGLRALLQGERYNNPNRYFAHQALYTYMRNVPLLLQNFVDAIYSVYMASAIAKTLLQAAMISLLAYFATGKAALNTKYFLICALLITPFFQTTGFRSQITLIDRATTYTFFYALPFVLLLIYFIPVYQRLFTEKKKKIPLAWRIILPIMAVVIALNGPLLPPTVIIAFGAIILYLNRHHLETTPYLTLSDKIKFAYADIPKDIFWQFVFFLFCCCYSYYIGTFNSENVEQLSLNQLYEKLWLGIWYELGQQAAFPLLLSSVLINIFIIRQHRPTSTSRRIVLASKWILVLCAVYVLLLPLGGYRVYRPYIIRRDSIMPVTMALIYLFSSSSLYLLYLLRKTKLTVYIAALTALIAFYSFEDVASLKDDNCEVKMQRIIAASPDKIVKLDQNCSVLNWGTITDYRESKEQGMMLKFWNITKDEKLFYYEAPQ